ncbi:unnamed protein product, partial [Gulo gulo]
MCFLCALARWTGSCLMELTILGADGPKEPLTAARQGPRIQEGEPPRGPVCLGGRAGEGRRGVPKTQAVKKKTNKQKKKTQCVCTTEV